MSLFTIKRLADKICNIGPAANSLVHHYLEIPKHVDITILMEGCQGWGQSHLGVMIFYWIVAMTTNSHLLGFAR